MKSRFLVACLFACLFNLSSAFASSSEEELQQSPSKVSHIALQASSSREKTQNVTFADSNADDGLILPSSPPKVSVVVHNTNIMREEKPEEGEWITQQIHLISKSLKLMDASILLEESKPSLASSSSPQESAILTTTPMEESGDIRNGLFLLLEAVKRPHRYHARFYRFDPQGLQTSEGIFLSDQSESARNSMLKRIFHTSPKVDLSLTGLMVTQSKPNKLILAIEEADHRILGSVQDFFGRIKAKVEEDPLAVVNFAIGGASRIAKAVVTNGASEFVQ